VIENHSFNEGTDESTRFITDFPFTAADIIDAVIG